MTFGIGATINGPVIELPSPLKGVLKLQPAADAVTPSPGGCTAAALAHPAHQALVAHAVALNQPVLKLGRELRDYQSLTFNCDDAETFASGVLLDGVPHGPGASPVVGGESDPRVGIDDDP